MAKTVAEPATTLVPQKGWGRFVLNFKRYWQLHLLLLLPTLYLIIFDYGPGYGLQIAWKDYSPRLGIWDSEWVGWVNFTKFFGFYNWPQLVWNTVAISLYDIATYPVPIFMALFMHIYTGKWLKKIVQNVSYVPHFISMVVMIGLMNTVLNPVTGFVGLVNRAFGNLAYEDIRSDPDAFRHLYIWSDIWKNCGWSSILYVSALTSVPDELHEAAKIDGASRLRRIFAIDLPTIMPIIAIKLIMQFGGIMSVGWQKAFLMQNDLNLETSELISTYIYKNGLRAGNLAFGTAIGLLQSTINTCLVFLVNAICNWLTDNEMGLF